MRTYCFLSLWAILLVMTAEMMRVVIHFKFKVTDCPCLVVRLNSSLTFRALQNVMINNCIHVVTTKSDICVSMKHIHIVVQSRSRSNMQEGPYCRDTPLSLQDGTDCAFVIVHLQYNQCSPHNYRASPVLTRLQQAVVKRFIQ